MSTIEQRVQAGVAWLTEKDAEWWKKIDPKKLNLLDRRLCILGQLYGCYFDARDKFNLSEEEVRGLGFYNEDRKEYEYLAKEWRTVLKNLQESQSL